MAPDSSEVALAESLILTTFRRREADIRQAITILERIHHTRSTNDPVWADCHMGLCMNYYLLRQFDHAKNATLKWLQLYPQDDVMWSFLAQICTVLGRPEEVQRAKERLSVRDRHSTGQVILKLGFVPILVTGFLVAIYIHILLRLLLVAVALWAMCSYLPRWLCASGQRNYNKVAAVIAGLLAGLGGLVLSTVALTSHGGLWCCLDPLFWAVVAMVPAVVYHITAPD